jgi:hypothetical protein
MATTKKKKPTWRITLVRKTGEHLGLAEPANADEAVKEFAITEPERQRGLVARRLD